MPPFVSHIGRPEAAGHPSGAGFSNVRRHLSRTDQQPIGLRAVTRGSNELLAPMEGISGFVAGLLLAGGFSRGLVLWFLLKRPLDFPRYLFVPRSLLSKPFLYRGCCRLRQEPPRSLSRCVIMRC